MHFLVIALFCASAHLIHAADISHHVAKSASARDDAIVCKPNSFVIKASVSGMTAVNANSELAVVYKLELAPGVTLPANVDLAKYTKACVQFIAIKAQTEGDDDILQLKLIKDEDNLSGLVSTFAVKPMTKYTIELGYTQTNSQKTIYGEKYEKQTCFGVPGPVQKINHKMNEDGSATVTWEQPAELKSPKLCHYLVVTKDSNGGSHELTTEKAEHKVEAKDLHGKVLDVRVYAVNDEKCFVAEHPSVKGCAKEASDMAQVFIFKDAPTQSTSTASSSTTTAAPSYVATSTSGAKKLTGQSACSLLALFVSASFLKFLVY